VRSPPSAAFSVDAPTRSPAYTADIDPQGAYQLLALAAATVRWAGHATGRSETEILTELGRNYGASPDPPGR